MTLLALTQVGKQSRENRDIDTYSERVEISESSNFLNPRFGRGVDVEVY